MIHWTATLPASGMIPEGVFLIASPITPMFWSPTRVTVRVVAQDFTNDHELAAKALRLPLGSNGAFGSPYLALLDLMKRWPASADRHSILLISSGIDYFRGGFDLRSPDLDSTISRAQKQILMLDHLCSRRRTQVARILSRHQSAIES